MVYTCQICNKNFNTQANLIQHFCTKHKNINFSSYDEKYKYFNFVMYNKEIPKCCMCGKNDIYVKTYHQKLHNICDNPECKTKYMSYIQKKRYIDNPEERHKASLRAIKRYDNESTRINSTYWKRSNGVLSYLENWFYEKIIKEYKLYEKYLIINEFTIKGPTLRTSYSLDFAFTTIKLDVELDGKQHFINGYKRIQHDIDRDNYLNTLGWNVYRISYYDIKNDEQKVINNFLSCLSTNIFNYNNETYFSKNVGIYKQKELKNKNKINKKQINKENTFNRKKELLWEFINEAHIDVTKFGWVEKAKQYMKEKYNYCFGIGHFILYYYPEFIKLTKCKIKNIGN